MAAMVFVNFPVTDLSRSIEFYTALGFQQNKEFSDDNAASMVWDDTFWIMLLTHNFYRKFIKDKEIADTQKVSGALIAFSLDSVDAVKAFGKKAEENGGSVHHVDMGIPESMMYGLEIQDPDGNSLEPSWMQME